MATWGEMGTNTHGGSRSLSGDPGPLIRDAPGARPSEGGWLGLGLCRTLGLQELAWALRGGIEHGVMLGREALDARSRGATCGDDIGATS